MAVDVGQIEGLNSTLRAAKWAADVFSYVRERYLRGREESRLLMKEDGLLAM